MAKVKQTPLSVCIIGAGNVATHLALALNGPCLVRQIFSRSEASAKRLADAIGCSYTTDTAALVPDADFYLIAVADDAVAEVVKSTPDYPGIWAHTSGSVPADVFSNHKQHYGVFYPLQTFTRDVEVDVSEVPFFIEGNTPEVTERLAAIARLISRSVEFAVSSTSPPCSPATSPT